MWRRGGDGGTGSYLTSAFLNSPFSLRGMLSSILDKFETEINLRYCVCLAGMHLENLPCLCISFVHVCFHILYSYARHHGKGRNTQHSQTDCWGPETESSEKKTHTHLFSAAFMSGKKRDVEFTWNLSEFLHLLHTTSWVLPVWTREEKKYRNVEEGYQDWTAKKKVSRKLLWTGQLCS